MLDMTIAPRLPARFLSCLAVLSLAAGAASCAAPLQNGGVVTTPGAAERLGVLCHFGHDVAGACAGPDEVETTEPAAPEPADPAGARGSSTAAPFPATPDATGGEAHP
jgi:hypothetical protein